MGGRARSVYGHGRLCRHAHLATVCISVGDGEVSPGHDYIGQLERGRRFELGRRLGVADGHQRAIVDDLQGPIENRVRCKLGHVFLLIVLVCHIALGANDLIVLASRELGLFLAAE